MCLGEVATVVAIDAAAGTATVDVMGRGRTVSLALHPDLDVGTTVVVHTGFVVDVLSDADPAADPDADREAGEPNTSDTGA